MANPYVVVDHIISDENQGINGTYNISFTTLQDGDRDAIAEWIGSKVVYPYEKLKNAPALPASAITYSTTDPQQIASVAGFHRVAFSGDYSHLANKPTFHTVAFSGDYNDLSNRPDSISFDDLSNVPELFSGKYEDLEHAPAIPNSAKIINNGTLTGVQPFANIAFTGSYNDLSNIPNLELATVATSGKYNDLLLAPGIPESAKVYSTTDPNAVVYINNLHDVAFSGNYDDLNYAPSIPNVNGSRPTAFNEVAFTGVNSNVITSNIINPIISNVLNLNSYTGSVTGMTNEQNNINTNKLRNLGSENTYILGLNSFTSGNISLINALSLLVSDFITYKKPSYIVSGQNIFLVIDIKRVQSAGADSYYEIELSNQIKSNYSDIRTIQNNITESQAQDIIDNLSIESDNNNLLIVDINNNLIYFQKENLALVAYSGFYNDLTDRPLHLNHVFNITQYQIPIDNALLENQLDYINTLGSDNGFLKGISNLKSSWDEELTDKISSVISAYQRQQTVLFINRNDIFVISNIQLITSGNVLQQIQISLSPIVSNTNYNELTSMSTSSDQEILDVLNNISFEVAFSCLIIDYSKDIMYSKVGYVIPTTFPT